MELNENTCRLCLSSDNPLDSVYEKLSEEEITELLQDTLKIDIKDSDIFTNICNDCVVKVQLMYNVLVEFKESDKLFQALLAEFRANQGMFEDEKKPNQHDIHIEVLGVVENDHVDKKIITHFKHEDDDENDYYSESIIQEDIIQESEIGPDGEIITEREIRAEDLPDITAFKPPTLKKPKKKKPNVDEQDYEIYDEIMILPEMIIEEDEDQYDDSKTIRCYICLCTFIERDDLVQHLEEHKNLLPYYCEKCLLDFTDVELLNIHFGMHQFAHGCLYCDRKYSTEEQLTDHNKYCRGFKCELCDRRFEYSAALNKHVKLEHTSDEQPHICTHCNKRFKHRCNLLRHWYNSICGAPKREKLKKGQRYPVPEKEKVETIPMKSFRFCDICGKECESNSQLADHIEKLHPEFGFQLYKCDKCEKKFTTLEKCRRHRFLHKRTVAGPDDRKKRPKNGPKLENLTICYICNAEFKYDRELIDHLKERHQDQQLKVYQCNLCERTFTTEDKLTKHHYNTHTDSRTQYVCTHCGKKFGKKMTLRDHENIHLGITAYNCDICDKSFSYKHSYDRHMKFVHTDVKDHICEFCNKAFKRKSTFIIHRRIHTGEKPFECQLCGVHFIDSSTLIKHRQKVHKCPTKSAFMRKAEEMNEQLRSITSFAGNSQDMQEDYSEDEEEEVEEEIEEHDESMITVHHF